MTLNDIVLLIITTLSSAFVLYLASKIKDDGSKCRVLEDE